MPEKESKSEVVKQEKKKEIKEELVIHLYQSEEDQLLKLKIEELVAQI